ncbi:cupin domain-containing protein [soil metagenome]
MNAPLGIELHVLNRDWRQKNIDWKPFSIDGRQQVQISRLYDDCIDGVGPVAALVKYLPGAVVPAHQHQGSELILVVEGELIDDEGVYGEGTMKIYAPGSVHALSSTTGCVFLVVWEQPVMRVQGIGAP